MRNVTLCALLLSGVMFTPAYAQDTPVIKKESVSMPQQSTPKINLNTADVPTLIQSFKGIGKKRAEAIVSYRTQHGSFKSLEELGEVQGIGKQFASKHLTELQQVFSIE